MEYDPQKEVIVLFPEGGSEPMPLNLIERRAGKPYLRKYHSVVQNRTYTECFLKKVGTDKYKILDKTTEDRLWKEEEHFWVDNFNKTLGSCDECGEAIWGKHALTINHKRRSIWIVEYRCPNCGNETNLTVDSHILDREENNR
jgi:hypothetical protein